MSSYQYQFNACLIRLNYSRRQEPIIHEEHEQHQLHLAAFTILLQQLQKMCISLIRRFITTQADVSQRKLSAALLSVHALTQYNLSQHLCLRIGSSDWNRYTIFAVF